MKKQTALLLSTLVLMTAVSMQPASAFSFKFLAKKEKAVVTAPVKKEVAPEAVVKQEVKKVEQDVKKVETKVEKKLEPVKPAVKPACPCAKPAVKAPVKPACPCAKPAVKAPVKK